MKAKRIFSLLVCALLWLTLMPVPALGAEAGDFIVTGGTLGADFSYDAGGGVLLFDHPGDYTVSMKNPGTITVNDKIQINAGTVANPVNLTLDNVGIINGYCAFDLKNTSYVNLSLEGDSRMISGANYPGIRCLPGASISIGGSGSLYAQGGSQGAGIGGDSVSNTNSGAITITGGEVISTGGSQAAGIGGAFGGTAGTITISGGTVIATGGTGGAGIGGGDSGIGSPGNGGTVYISGGSVKATGTSGGEDIGKGRDGTVSGTLTNGPGGSPLYLTTVTLDGVGPGTAVHSLTTGSTYGTEDMQTDTSGNLYLYLPESTHTTAAQTTDGGSPATIREYTGDIVTNVGGSSGTLSLVFIPVTGITGVPTAARAGTDLTLTGTAVPANASNKAIIWSLTDGGTTGAAITGNILSTTAPGSVIVTATITNGVAETTDYTQDFTINVNTAPAGSDNDGSHTLTESATGITVSGAGIRSGTKLIIKPLSLHEPGQCAACDTIRQYMADNSLTVLFDADLSLSRSCSGGLTISIPVGTQYDGQTLTLLHCHDGVLETLTAMVVDGQAVFTLSALSPVALVTNTADAAEALDNIPITGDSGSTFVWWLLCGLSAAGIVVLITREWKLSRQ